MKLCEACNKEFLTDKWHPKQKFCSQKCGKNASHRRNRGLPIRMVDLICAVCDSKFQQKRANNSSYCSNDCKRLSSSRRLRGIPINGPRKHIFGSGYITSSGYRMISMKHPNASKRGQIMEHIVIMTKHLGRALINKETVHHKNGIRSDNRLENLELWSHSHPSGQRVEDKIKWCKEFLEQYGYQVIMKEKQ